MRIVLVLICFCTFKSYSQDGRNLLEKSSQAIKSMSSIHYTVYAEGSGMKTTADVIVNRNGDYPVFETAQVKVVGIALSDGGSEAVSFASNGSRFEYIDAKTNELTGMNDINYQKLSRTGMAPHFLLVLPVYFQKEPFANVLANAKQISVTGDTTLYAVNCYVVKVESEFTNSAVGTVKSSTQWLIGKKDHLVYGLITSVSKQFFKIKSTNTIYGADQFSLSSSNPVKEMTGTEPMNEGLLALKTVAPEWVLPSSMKDSIRLSELKGKVVLLDFWGTWCVPCIKAMPEIQAIHEYFKNDKRVVVIGVSVETEKAADPVAFMKRKNYTYPIALNGTTITSKYKVVQFPTVYIIDKNGKVFHAEYGGNREHFKEDIIAKMEKALKQ